MFDNYKNLINYDDLLDKQTVEVLIISEMLYAVLPDGRPEFSVAAQIVVQDHLYIHPLVLECDVKEIPVIGSIVKATYHEKFYLGKIINKFGNPESEVRFGLNRKFGEHWDG